MTSAKEINKPGAPRRLKAASVYGRNVLRLADAAGLSLYELARRAGLAYPALWRSVMTGAGTPRLDTAAAVAGALGVRIEALLREGGR